MEVGSAHFFVVLGALAGSRVRSGKRHQPVGGSSNDRSHRPVRNRNLPLSR
ncbi:MAG: hypothetical protein AAF268_10330 [Cyanobacteria bacterium P01_A01_bin.3]